MSTRARRARELRPAGAVTDCCAACATALLALHAACATAQSPDASDWGYYGGDSFGQRYSKVDQITRDNVHELAIAWTYRTGEIGKGFAQADALTFEATPVMAFGQLFLETATNIVIALDPRSGAERWRYDPHIDRTRHYADVAARGVTVWQSPDTTRTGPCSRRVYTGTLDARLVSLDAMTGTPCADFGADGQIDLTAGMRILNRDEYLVTSPPVIHGNVIVVGSSIGDNRATTVERGVIHAFDVRTGTARWSFDPLPDGPAHPAAHDWDLRQAAATGAANAWGLMSVDDEHGLVFVPTGSASPDFYGGERRGDNRFADSLLAIDAASGRVIWHQQLVHHDLWDFDLAAEPVLADISVHQGAPIPAVIQATKTGMLYAFDRTDGRPLYPISERPVPQSHVPGEQAAPTQPFSSLPALVPPRPINPADAWGITFWDRSRCRQLIETYRNEGIFTPPDERGTLLSPGYIGGVDWGGIAVDEAQQRVYAAVNRVPMVVTLGSREALAKQAASGEFPHSQFAQQLGTPYGMRREPLLSPWGLPCTAPPWGTLVSVDLHRRRIVWEVPLGSTEGVAPKFLPVREFGTAHMGGPIVTAGNLVFVAATMDSHLRAFDAETGHELWKYALPAGGQATPMTYRAGPDERQYLVIAAGGHGKMHTPRGDYVVAFALPHPPPAQAPQGRGQPLRP